ncbi:hypothetical protein EX30DRAFT_390194 [Ascodesmis nigricans]|uniref:Uncharacterized protein n=1 Tax=Ascodesmis nigricans TaxID=341454 RepID=A0A4S2MI76_9PEZI|nr:hypothetical protein EX30DRAFT_390194 [Ascodesmis nigricans]
MMVRMVSWDGNLAGRDCRLRRLPGSVFKWSLFVLTHTLLFSIFPLLYGDLHIRKPHLSVIYHDSQSCRDVDQPFLPPFTGFNHSVESNEDEMWSSGEFKSRWVVGSVREHRMCNGN